MFAVKSTYSIKTPDGNVIPFYVAGDSISFAVIDLNPDINTELFPDYYFVNFDNYKGKFINFFELKEGCSFNSPRCFYKNKDFWMHFVYHNDTAKVIAEVRDAQKFAKKCFELDLPEEWSLLKADWVINTLPIRTSAWIEKCHNSLRILATNDKQKQLASRVHDEAWKILKAREKDATADKRPIVHETLAKFGLTDDDLIHAILDVHETKFCNEQARRKTQFAKQHDELLSELRMLLK